MADDFSAFNPDEIQEPIPQAFVTIGDEDPEDQESKYLEEGDDQTIWANFLIFNRYEKDRHVAMLPIASPNGFQGKKVAFAQMAEPTLIWIADWTAARWKVQPRIPDPEELADSNWVLLDEHYEPTTIEPGADGVIPYYRINGTYVYGHKSPAQSTIDNCKYPRPPWLDDVFKRTVESDKLTPRLIDGDGGSYMAPTT